jgi:hypothetical protein
MSPLARFAERLYRRGRRSQWNHHRLVTVLRLQGEGVSPALLLQAAFDAFRPGDDQHAPALPRWWGNGRLTIQRLQMWAGGVVDDQGIYTWQAKTARTLVHHYTLATPFGHVRFAAALERATDPKASQASLLESIVRMGDPRDPTLYGPGGAVPAEAMELVTDVEGTQAWSFRVEGDSVRIAHVSEGRRLARDAALFTLFGPAPGWLFRLLHDREMRRGLRPLPAYLTRQGRYASIAFDAFSEQLHGREITLRVERPAWPRWLERIAG